jgi:ATP-dependent protease ClpP protease subunit
MHTSSEDLIPFIQEGLLDRRAVMLAGEIDADQTREVARRMVALQLRSTDPINLLIDSGGGDVDWALRLCDLMTTMLTVPVRGIAVGSCGSAATFVMLHCSERIGTPYARFLIHSGMRNKISIPINQTTSENLEQLLKEVRAREEMVLKLYMERLTPKAWAKRKPASKRCRDFVLELIARGDQRFDDWIFAKEAIEVGLIQRIEHKKLEIFSK